MLLLRSGFQFGLDLAVGGGRFLQGALQLLVRLLLDGLRVLQFLNQLHFDALHIQNLVLLLLAHGVLEVGAVVLVALRHLQLAALLLLHLHLGEALLLVHDLVLHLVLSLNLELVVANLLLVLRALDFGLLGLLGLAQVDGLLNFALLLGTLLLNHVVLVGVVALHLELVLHLPLFLHTIAR